MKNIFPVVFLLSLTVLPHEFAHAQIGILKEVVEAAKKNKEPAYIEELMVHLSGELWRFAQSREIYIPNQRLAMYDAMRIVVGAVLNAAWDAAVDAGGTFAWDAAVDAIGTIAEDGIYKTSGDVVTNAYEAVRAAAWKSSLEAADIADKSGASEEEVARIAYRVAEWVALNWLLENVHSFLDKVYPTRLAELDDNPADNPFENDKSVLSFMNIEFGSLKCSAMLYLAPWLAQIVSVNQVPEIHRPVFQAMCPNMLPWRKATLIFAGHQHGTLDILPREVVKLILSVLADVRRAGNSAAQNIVGDM